MNKYEVKYIDEDGVKNKSYIYVENIDDAIQKISEKYDEVLELKEVKFYFIERFFYKNKISEDIICNFCDSLNVLLKSGIPIQRALEILERQTKDKGYRENIKIIKSNILNGNTFSHALKEVNMPEFMCNLVEVGETAGKLEETLDLIYNYYFDKNKVKQVIKNATYYPIIVLIAMIMAVVVSIFSVIPSYATIFESNGQRLPMITRMLVTISEFVINNIYGIIISTLIFIILVSIFLNSKLGVRLLDVIKLKNNIYINILNHNFSISMYILLGSSIDIIKSLEITTKLIDNEIVNIHIEEIKQSVLNGMPLSYCLRQYDEFSKILISLCEVGEESGQIAESFYKSSNIFKNNIDNFLQTLQRRIEVGVTIALGSVLGLIMLSIILPTYTIINTI